MSDEHTISIDASDIQVRDASKRELDIRIVPWGVEIDTVHGLEEFRRGAFADTKPEDVFLMGLEHEAHLGVGQTGQPMVTRHPTGKAIALDDREDGQYGTFRVAKTSRGDEQLALAIEGIVTGASAEFLVVPGGSEDSKVRGRRKTIHNRARLTGVATTYRPAYATAGVVAVRAHQEGSAPVAEDQAPATGVEEKHDTAPVVSEVSTRANAELADLLAKSFDKPVSAIMDRLEKLEEQNRASFTLGGPEAPKPEASLGDWAYAAVRILKGENLPPEQYRLVADLITSENAGIVPDAHLQELIGIIDSRRPFANSTRRIPVPSSGTSLVVPKITERPTTGIQSAEKQEVSSNDTTITTESFDMVTIAGVGDISYQLLRRADRSFLQLFIELLGEAYAADAEDHLTDALIAAVNDGGPEPAGPMDPEDLNLGAAFQASFTAMRRGPDTIWLSSEAVGEFLDAKNDGSNSPLYGNLGAAFTATQGPGGGIMGLRPVHVPALDNKGAYAIVGPSAGMAWAEEGTFTLQVDVPSKLGRDVALGGFLFPVPWYPAAFTLYNVAS